MTVAALSPVLPTPVHRAAADRAARLATHNGAVEVLAFYDSMTPGERRIAFALLARLAGRHHIKPLDNEADSPWWTPAELRLAHSLWVGGHRSEWINTGHKLYVRDNARVRRDAARLEPVETVRRGHKPRAQG